MGLKYCPEGHLMDPAWKKCPICLAPLSGWLVRIRNDRPEKVYTLHDGKSFIGCGTECEIRISDCNLSMKHAYLSIIEGFCRIVDMGNSPTPLQVNSHDAVNSTLVDGDMIKLGDGFFKIKLI
jgi:hypothetical protein